MNIIKDKDVIINRCIVRSKDITLAKAARISLRNTKYYLNRLITVLPSQQHIVELDVELINVIDMYQKEIANWLKPIFMESEVSNKNTFWFCEADLKRGWLITHVTDHFTSTKYVLFLSPTVDVVGKTIAKGEIKPYSEVKSILSAVKPACSIKSAVFKYALNVLKNE